VATIEKIYGLCGDLVHVAIANAGGSVAEIRIERLSGDVRISWKGSQDGRSDLPEKFPSAIDALSHVADLLNESIENNNSYLTAMVKLITPSPSAHELMKVAAGIRPRAR